MDKKDNSKRTYKGIIIEKGTLDKEGIKIDILNVGFGHKEVPVRLGYDEKKEIGMASTYVEDGVLKANIKIDESKLLGGKYANIFSNLTPGISGRVTSRKGNKIKKFDLLSVGLCASPNKDKSIGTLRKQEKKN